MKNNAIDFLIKAKKSAYAGNGAENAPSRPDSHDFEISCGDFKYTDSYFGSKKFVGEEVLFENGSAVWSMNYVGRKLDDSFDFEFLKEALLQATPDMPYRGPREFRKGNFTYICSVNGGFDFFSGYEEILNYGVRVYECVFNGGIIE